MNKDDVIRNLRYEKEKHKNDRVDTFGTDISMLCTDILELLENCIEIPYGATNGDMMEAVFPDKSAFNGGEGAYFKKDWWDAKYKREGKE